jgi:hypothetical protein
MPRVRQAKGDKAFSSTANNAGRKRTLKRSSRVIPGFRGTPAGMTTTLAPVRASPNPWLDLGGHDPGEGNDPDTLATVGICWSQNAGTYRNATQVQRKTNHGLSDTNQL